MNEFSNDRSVARFLFFLFADELRWEASVGNRWSHFPLLTAAKAMWSEPKSWPPAISVRSTRGSPGGVGAGDNPDSWQLSELHMHLLQVPLARKE